MTNDAAHPIKPAQAGRAWIAPAVFAVLTLAMFGGVLVNPHKLLSSTDTDIVLQFLPWRAYGFGQIANRNFPLWNPHVFGGAPYFAGFQSALLYPPNWLHLILPLAVAINWIIALHVFGAGYFTYLWCRHRSLSRGGSILAGVMFMFSGPYFLHIYAGHLPHLALMPWVPLLFLSIDGCFDDARNYRWWLLGAFVFAMMLLAGHPQYVYYTGMAAAVYVVLNLIRPPVRELVDNRLRFRAFALLGCATIVVCGILFSAVQLLAGIQAAGESVRAGGISYEMSASFSFPPENFLTLLAPHVWGRLPMRAEPLDQPWQYFGRCYLWEVSAFVSVTGLVLAIFGMCTMRGGVRRFATTMVFVTALLALGAHTPLHKFLYYTLPKFGEFRGSTKFMFLTAMFLSMLAVRGFDELHRARRTPRSIIIGVACLLAALLLTALAARASGGAGRFGGYGLLIRRFIEGGGNSGEIFYNPTGLADAQFIRAAALVTSNALLVAAVTAAVTLLILTASRFKPKAICGLIALVIVEMFVFACRNRATTSADVALPAEWQNTVKSVSPDDRVLLVDASSKYDDYGMWKGFNSLWGYDPGVLRRYAEVMYASQGMNPDQAGQYLSFHQLSPVLSMERCALIVTSDPKTPAVRSTNVMPVASLIPNHMVVPQRKQMLNMLAEGGFDPRVWVALEREPAIKPAGSRSNGSVVITRESTDMLELQADVTAASILLITNNYSEGWRIVPLSPPPQGQNRYELMPANWTLQAIPLAAGQHRLRIEYSPAAFRIGAWISSIAVIGYAGSWGWLLFTQRRKRRVRTRR